MSYLLDFIRALSPSELTCFHTIDVIGKEEMVRDVYAKNAAHPKFDEGSLAARLKLSQSHLDKITSVLLDKALSTLYRDDHAKTFLAILQKGLSSLMLHEVKTREKKVLRQNDPVKITRFYKAAFESLRGMYHPNYDSKLTHQFGKKYLKALGEKQTMADKCFVAMLALYADIIAACYGGNDSIFKPVADGILKEWESKDALLNDPPSTFYISFARATFCKHMTDDTAPFIRANEAALAALDSCEGWMRDKYKGIIICELGLGCIFSEQYPKALEYYHKAFDSHDETIGKNIYHTANYFIAAGLTQDFKEANRIFMQYLNPKILPSTNPSVLFDIYMLAAWSQIQQGEFTQAFSYLTKLKERSKKSITLMGHVMFRQLESAYFYLSGDIPTAVITIGKNLRFIKRTGLQHSSFSYWFSYIEVIDKLIKMELGTLRFPEKLKDQIAALPGGIYENYNRPLREKYDKLSGSM